MVGINISHRQHFLVTLNFSLIKQIWHRKEMERSPIFTSVRHQQHLDTKLYTKCDQLLTNKTFHDILFFREN